MVFTPFLFGANLVALSKKGGGVRPVAVGSVLRRLVSKSVMATIGEKATSHLAPYQYG
jgi:hypothetical protein